jgi:hypothetical protein
MFFFKSLLIKTLDLDRYRIGIKCRIRIRFETNAEPKHRLPVPTLPALIRSYDGRKLLYTVYYNTLPICHSWFGTVPNICTYVGTVTVPTLPYWLLVRQLYC